jgi:hypothetical protein
MILTLFYVYGDLVIGLERGWPMISGASLG